MNEAARLLSAMITNGLRTIAFVRTRAVAERLYDATRERLDARLRGQLACYRAGYTVDERREIERRLFGGELLGVVATTALEVRWRASACVPPALCASLHVHSAYSSSPWLKQPLYDAVLKCSGV